MVATVDGRSMGSVDDVFGRGASRGEKGRGKREEGGGEEPPTEGGASSVDPVDRNSVLAYRRLFSHAPKRRDARTE